MSERDERYRSLLRLSADFFWETDANHRLTAVARGQRTVTLHQSGAQIGKTRWELPYTRPDEAGWRAHRETLDRHSIFRDFEYARLTPDGRERHFRISGEPIFGAEGSFLGYRGFGQDITELKLAEAVLRESELRFRSLTELSSDWLWEQDEHYRFTFMSGGRNAKPVEIVGKTPWECPGIEAGEEQWGRLRADMDARRPYQDFVVWRTRRSGGRSYYSVSGRPVFDTAGRFKGYRGTGRDITERMLSQERVEHLAYHDALTGLKSRSYFMTALAHAVQQARRSGRRLALIFIDLDGFKNINDTLGHDAGDHLLKEIGVRLTASLRKGDLVGRFGGDEFVVLIEDAADRQRLELIANKLPAEIVKPLVFAGREMRVTASIGISVFPEDAGDEHGLMKNADAAMYRGKQKGKNVVCFYADPPVS